MRAALGKPFSKHCPELHGMNSDGLCLTIRFSVAEAAFKKQFSDGLLDGRAQRGPKQKVLCRHPLRHLL